MVALRPLMPEGRHTRTVVAGLGLILGCVAFATSAGAQDTGQLVVVTTPPGLRVLVDGEPAGNSPVTLVAVSPGEHRVTVPAEHGGQSVERIVTVTAGRPSVVEIELEGSSSPEPLALARTGESVRVELRNEGSEEFVVGIVLPDGQRHRGQPAVAGLSLLELPAGMPSGRWLICAETAAGERALELQVRFGGRTGTSAITVAGPSRLEECADGLAGFLTAITIPPASTTPTPDASPSTEEPEEPEMATSPEAVAPPETTEPEIARAPRPPLRRYTRQRFEGVPDLVAPRRQAYAGLMVGFNAAFATREYLADGGLWSWNGGSYSLEFAGFNRVMYSAINVGAVVGTINRSSSGTAVAFESTLALGFNHTDIDLIPGVPIHAGGGAYGVLMVTDSQGSGSARGGAGIEALTRLSLLDALLLQLRTRFGFSSGDGPDVIAEWRIDATLGVVFGPRREGAVDPRELPRAGEEVDE